MAKGKKEKKTGDYAVGYGKPPQHGQFRKGRSGNPKGRPKKSKNMSTIMKELMESPVTIRQNGRQRNAPFCEAFVHRLAARAMDGSPRDMIAMMKAIHDYMPDVLKTNNMPDIIKVEFVDSDGQGRPADKSRWKDCPPGSSAYESYKRQKERDKDPAVIAAWELSGLADEDDKVPE